MGNSFPSVTMEIFKGCQSSAITDFPIVPLVMWELSVSHIEKQGFLPQCENALQLSQQKVIVSQKTETRITQNQYQTATSL